MPEFAHAEDLVIEPDGTRVPGGRGAGGGRDGAGDADALSQTDRREEGLADAGDHRQRARLHQHASPGPRRPGSRTRADFVIGDHCADCAGFMTFGPGSTYGEEGVGAESAYMVLTWIGIAFMVARPDRLDRLREPPPGRLRAGRWARLRRAGVPQPGITPEIKE